MSVAGNTVSMLCAFVVTAVVGLGAIPYFRKLKTGRFEARIGDRYKKDDGTAKFGGVIILAGLLVGCFVGIIFLNNENNRTIGSENAIAQLVCSLVFCILMCLAGVVQDYIKDRKKQLLGIRGKHLFVYEFLLSLMYLIALYLCGNHQQEVLLPFRLGYIEFGLLYYPLMALGITAGVNMVKIHDCFGGNTDSSVDGLMSVTVLIFSLFMANASDNSTAVLAFASVGAFAGFLVWGLAPAKLYVGESGGVLAGAVVSAMVFLSGLHFMFVLLGLAFVVDTVCMLIQRGVFKINKKIVFKGANLHEHLIKCEWSAYKIIMVFSAISIVGGIAGIMFEIYSKKL